jgi:hypothetical protein
MVTKWQRNLAVKVTMQSDLSKSLLALGAGSFLLMTLWLCGGTFQPNTALAVDYPAGMMYRQMVQPAASTTATPTATPTLQLTSQPTSTPTLPPPPQIAGCDIFPADNIWNTPVDTLPVDANSAAYINTMGSDRTLHPDFGAGLWEGGPIGIPYRTVTSSQAKVTVTFDYADESDAGPYPIPTDAPIEGGPAGDGDRHVLLLDQNDCMLYELFYAFPQNDGSWTAGAGAIFDLDTHTLRPDSWTSADAAGLPILPGLVRYDEVASGEIRHAIRFTASQTRRAYVWPARHHASNLTATNYPPMGQRFRLRADFALDGFSPTIQVILRAMQKYGIILADNGSDWYISGVPDERWDNDLLRELRQLTGSNFEAVDVTSLMVHPDSGQVRLAAPVPQNNYVYLPLVDRP